MTIWRCWNITLLLACTQVQLANTLRLRMGNKVLAQIRDQYGGLLALLERFPRLFKVHVGRVSFRDVSPGNIYRRSAPCFGHVSQVDRIPKNDTVSLLDDNGYSPVGHVSQSNSHHSGGSSSSSSQATSRCLHVGNVAAHLTEEELRRQFSVYGHIQALK